MIICHVMSVKHFVINNVRMKQDGYNQDYQYFASQIKSHIDDTFSKYNREVEKRNEEQIGGILHKNDKS